MLFQNVQNFQQIPMTRVFHYPKFFVYFSVLTKNMDDLYLFATSKGIKFFKKHQFEYT